MNQEINSIDASDDPTLFLIGLDGRLTQLLSSMRLRIASFRSPEEFLAQCDPNQPGCIVSEVVFTNGISGLQLLSVIRERFLDLPVILVSSVTEVSLALRAVSEGAITLLSTSCEAPLAWEAVNRGLQQNRDRRIRGTAQRRVIELIGQLSEREAQVLRLISEGLANKQIAAEMGVSLRSVEKWRKDGLEKVGIESPLLLLRMLMQAGFQNWPRLES